MCVSFYYFPDCRRTCHSCLIWNSIAYITTFQIFTILYGLKNLWMGCIKQILTALLFGEWQKMIVPSVKFNLCLLFTSALRASVNSRQRLNFTSGQQFSTIPLMSSQYLYIITPDKQVLLYHFFIHMCAVVRNFL